MKRYGLARWVLGSPAFVDISGDEYSQIQSAKAKLFEVLFIEEKLDLVIENYLELETDLLDTTARHMVLRNQDYMWFQTERNRASRRLINLLSACRSYLDQIRHHLHNIFGKEAEIITAIEEYISQQYDQCLGYRVMEALRNYVQHRGFPLHTLTFNSKWVESKAGEMLLFSLTPYIRPETLAEDKKFKKSVLEEIKSSGEDIDIKPLIRDYIGSLGNIHEKIRGALKEGVNHWTQVILGAMNRFQETYPDEPSLVGLAAVVRNDDGTCSQPIQLFKDFMEYRQQLEAKNSNLNTLAKRYVTSEVIEARPHQQKNRGSHT